MMDHTSQLASEKHLFKYESTNLTVCFHSPPSWLNSALEKKVSSWIHSILIYFESFFFVRTQVSNFHALFFLPRKEKNKSSRFCCREEKSSLFFITISLVDAQT